MTSGRARPTNDEESDASDSDGMEIGEPMYEVVGYESDTERFLDDIDINIDLPYTKMRLSGHDRVTLY